VSRDLNVRSFAPGDVPPAAELLAARHRANRATYPILPARFEEPSECAEVIRSTMTFADGLVAESEGGMAGFLFGIKNYLAPDSPSARYGPARTSMMFAHGHAAAPGADPYAVYNALFAALAEQYLPSGIFDHTAHVPAGDRALDEAWSSLGFGRALAVAARTTDALPAPASAEVRPGTPDDLEAVYRIAASGNAFHARPPIFTAYLERDTERTVRESLRKGLSDESEAIFVGYAEREPAGILWVGPPRGSPLFTPDNACYIGDTAVLPGERHSGLGTAMLASALEWARERGYAHATLHFATPNPVSSAFWTGHGFQPVMYHLRRHIDERIAWATPPAEFAG
jgi:GNAT superfamily N-acetyltransferase